jgi:hypothetical protein
LLIGAYFEACVLCIRQSRAHRSKGFFQVFMPPKTTGLDPVCESFQIRCAVQE